MSQSSRENATPSSGTSPLASYKEVPPPPPRAAVVNVCCDTDLFVARRENAKIFV